MADDVKVEVQALSADEIEQESAEELPDREEMSLINLNAAIPINAGIAANVLSDNATAIAQAAQTGSIGQTT
jgi:hypothetical protein